jgi:putative oxidoreductase
VALVRRLARPMLGAVFIAGGIDALLHPGPRVEVAASVGARLARPLGLPEDPKTLVRINAAVQVGAGTLLATGRVPRLAALALLGSLVPTTVAGHQFWSAPGPEKAHHRTHFLKNLGLGGGLLLAAVDTEGKPSLGWRARHATKLARKSTVRAAESVRESAGERVDDLGDLFDDFTDKVDDLAHALTDRLPG